VIDELLSIRAAAAACGTRPAISLRDRELGFSEVAAAAAGREPASAIIAHLALATLLDIYAALERRQPIALLHARLSAAALARQRAALAASPPPPGTAFVLFTSGSTGEPRGVAVSRAAIAAAAAAHAERFEWQADDRWLACLPLAHAGGLAIIVRCLAARRTVVLHEGDPDASAIARLAIARRATLASLVPAQLTELADPLRAAPLRAVLLGGAAASPAQLATAGDLPVHTTYGLTETFGQVATAPSPGQLPVALPGVTLIAGSCAAPAPIRVRGPMLATCYLDGRLIAPELETADLGYVDRAGALHVCGRVDDVIISGGENVHPFEIEAVLTATPGVRAACAVGIPDPRWGQLIAAALVTDASFDRDRALASWRATLPPHAVPRRLALVHELPVLPSGKVDRRGVQASLQSAP
jgi:O-succinylbenzoic acid--CoA ligase